MGSFDVDQRDAYLGGERSGGKRGRGVPGKTPFVAAVQTNELRHPLRMKLTVVEGFRLTEIAAWAQHHLGTGTRVASDGLACLHGVTAAGCVHEPVVVGSGKSAVERPEFQWVNTILGKALLGTWMKQAQNDGELAIGFRITRINEQQQRQLTPVSRSDLGIFDWSSPNWHIMIPTVHVNFTRVVYD